jgi:hypothetical protein
MTPERIIPPGAESHVWGPTLVDVRILKVYKSKNVEGEQPVDVRDGDVLKVSGIDWAVVGKSRRTPGARHKIQQGDEAFFFLKVGDTTSSQKGVFPALSIFPVIDGNVGHYPLKNVYKTTGVKDIEKDIYSVINIIGGGGHGH